MTRTSLPAGEQATSRGFLPPANFVPASRFQAASPGADGSGPSFLAGGGEMGALMRSVDWSETPIGPVETWSQTLRTMVSFLLANRFPLLLWWGPRYISIYNDAYRPILGTKHPKALGQPVSECWSEIWHVLKPLIDTPFNGGPATWIEDLAVEINRHGFFEETHFTVAYSPVPDETAARGIGGVLATVHEITEKVIGERRVTILRDLGSRAAEAKVAEEACVTAAAVLANHAKDVPFAVFYLLDADGTRARLAATAGIVAGAPASPLVMPIDAAGAPWPVEELIRRRELIVAENLESRFATLPTGPWPDPPNSAVLVPLHSNKRGELLGFVVAGVSSRLRLDDLYHSFFELMAAQIATSIVNARAYEEERKRAEALAEIDRAKTTFFSNVSHEFRTPLTLMLGPLEQALGLPAEALPQHREDLVLAHRSGLRLLRLVNTLLDFSRIEAGRAQASYEPVDFATLTSGLAGEFRAATDKAGLRLVIDCEPLRQPVWVDRDMWEKIVLNLLSNAFKFTLEGAITVRLGAEGGSAVLTVEDTGTGIPGHELPQIFDRFHRVDGARGRTHEGTGIGLALVQELTKLHGGSVEAASEVGKGSSFRVRIPFGTAHLPAERLKAARSLSSTAIGAQPFVEEALRWLPGASSASDPEGNVQRDLFFARSLDLAEGERPSVLIAEDNADMRHFMERLLVPHFEVRMAADGLEALDAVRAMRPDLLLSDVMMPRLDGFDLVRQLRADPALAGMPIILLSARAGEEARIEGLQLGVDDYLVKPFSSRELLARVSANLKISKLRRELQERLAADLRSMARLRELGMQCGRADAEQDDCLLRIVDAALAITGADKGTLQLVVSDTGELRMAAQRGFAAPFLADFADWGEGAASYVEAMRSSEHVVVEDVATSTLATGDHYQKLMANAGVRAFISTPLISSEGALLGVISAYFAAPHRPSERKLHFSSLLARQTTDYLERRRAGEIQEILLRELQHRSNNLLTVVQAIANGSLSGDRSLKEARIALEARLQALARANRRLTNSSWSGIRFEDVVRAELTPFFDKVSLEGPDIMVGPKNAQNISLAVHELATNAAKYGALSAQGGRVTVSWSLASDGDYDVVNFKWRESGGPPVVAPTRSGFGTTLLRAIGLEGCFDFAPSGLTCGINLRLRHEAASDDNLAAERDF